jgi:hypothetical protein
MNQLNANSGGVTNFQAISTGELYIRGRRFIDYINEIVFEDNLDDAEIQEIQTFLARLDITGLTGNLILTDANRNATLLGYIQALQSKTALLDTTSLTQSWLITDANRNATLLNSITSVQGDITAININLSTLNTKTQYISSSSQVLNIGEYSLITPVVTNLRGNINTSQAFFQNLNTSSIFGWSDFITLINSTNLPSYLVSAAISAATSFMPSDIVKMSGSVSKSGDIETTNDVRVSEFKMFNTSVVGLDILSKFLVFMMKGNAAITTGLGDVAIQTFSGHAFMRNNNISATSIDWAVTEQRDKCNIVSIQNNDILIHLGASSAGGDIEVINSCGGDIVFKNGTNGLKSGTTSVMKIKYNPNFLDQIEMGLIDPNLNWATNNSKLFVVQLYNQTNGITVGSPDLYPATNHKFSYYNSTHANTGALILQDNYSGTTNKALYTQDAGQKLFYSGQQVFPPLPQNVGGVGLTYLIRNPTNANAPQTLTMSEAYLSQPLRTITLSAYNANQNYLLATSIGSIPKVSNPVISGVMQHDQFLSYTANSGTGQIWDVVSFRATASQNAFYNHPTRTDISFNNVLRYNYPTQNTSDATGAFITGAWIPVCNNSASISFHTVTIPYVALSGTGTNTARLTIENAVGATLYTFPVDFPYTSGAATPPVLVFGGTSLVTLNITNTTQIRFRVTNQAATNPSCIQAGVSGAQGQNGMMYVIHGDANQVYTTLLFDGVNNKTNLVNNVSDDYVLTLPITTMDITQLFEPNLQIETYFVQPSGTTSNHSVVLQYNDGFLSHVDSTFSTTTEIPTIQQVLTSGNNAGNLNILSLGTIEPSAITGWNVKEITAGTNISRTISSGTYTIANTAPVQNITTTGNLSVSIANNTANLSNSAPVQNITTTGNLSVSIANNTANLSNTAPVQNLSISGSGLGLSIANNVANLSNTGILEINGGNGIVVETINGVSTISQSIFTAIGSLNDPAITETALRPNKLPQYYGQRWKEQTQIPQATYYDVFVSKDGQTIAICGSTAISGGETIKVSHDYGATFDNALNTSPAYVYVGICGSSTGYIMYAISNNPKKIVKSNDFGYTFTALADPLNLDFPNSAPSAISCSSDGKFVMISDARANGFGKVYSSGDFGANWNTYNIVNNTAYSSTSCMSANGQVRYIILQTNNNLSSAGVYRTNNYGSTWEKRLSKINANDTEYNDITCDANGKIVVVSRVFGSNSLYTMVSQDYGSTWFSTGISDIYSVSISPNSSIIWAGAHNGKLYYSNDQGWNFKLLDNLLVGSTPHANIATNGDGSIVFSTFYGNSTTRPYAFAIHPIEDIAQKHYFSFTQNLLQPVGNTTFYNLPNDMDLQNFEYFLTIDIDKVWFNKYIYLGLNGSQNLAHQYNAIYYSSSSTNSPQTLSNTQWNTLTSGANQIYQASDSGQFPIWYSPNSGTFYFASSSIVFRMYSVKKDHIILERQGHTHYRTFNISGQDGKGTANSLGNGIGIDYTSIRGQIDITSCKIYLETNTKWAPSSIQFYYTSDTNIAGNASVKISDITRKAKNKITY